MLGSIWASQCPSLELAGSRSSSVFAGALSCASPDVSSHALCPASLFPHPFVEFLQPCFLHRPHPGSETTVKADHDPSVSVPFYSFQTLVLSYIFGTYQKPQRGGVDFTSQMSQRVECLTKSQHSCNSWVALGFRSPSSVPFGYAEFWPRASFLCQALNRE